MTAQYRKRVSISPNESPAKTPDGCCSDNMTEQGGGHGGNTVKWRCVGKYRCGQVVNCCHGTILTAHNTRHIDHIKCIMYNEDLYSTKGRQNMRIVVRMRAKCTCRSPKQEDRKANRTYRPQGRTNQLDSCAYTDVLTCFIIPTTHHILDCFVSI